MTQCDCSSPLPVCLNCSKSVTPKVTKEKLTRLINLNTHKKSLTLRTYVDYKSVIAELYRIL